MILLELSECMAKKIMNKNVLKNFQISGNISALEVGRGWAWSQSSRLSAFEGLYQELLHIFFLKNKTLFS